MWDTNPGPHVTYVGTLPLYNPIGWQSGRFPTICTKGTEEKHHTPVAKSVNTDDIAGMFSYRTITSPGPCRGSHSLNNRHQQQTSSSKLTELGAKPISFQACVG